MRTWQGATHINVYEPEHVIITITAGTGTAPDRWYVTFRSVELPHLPEVEIELKQKDLAAMMPSKKILFPRQESQEHEIRLLLRLYDAYTTPYRDGRS